MNCPKCDGQTKVTKSARDCESVHRERQCLECGIKFYTEEYERDGQRLKELYNERNNFYRNNKKHNKMYNKNGVITKS